MKLIENSLLNFDFLESELRTQEELALVNPSATLPFDQSYWRNFFTENPHENPAISLYFELNGLKVGHTAFKRFKDRGNQTFLCFVYLSNNLRGMGRAEQMYTASERFLIERFGVNEYWLNVLSHNIRALRSYEKFGFQIASESKGRFQMVKKL